MIEPLATQTIASLAALVAVAFLFMAGAINRLSGRQPGNEDKKE